MGNAAVPEKLHIDRQPEEVLLIRLADSWKLGTEVPPADEVVKHLQTFPQIKQLTFDTHDLTGWDSTLLIFLAKVIATCAQKNIDVNKTGLPEGVRRLLDLAAAVPERKGARREEVREPFLSRVGGDAMNFGTSSVELLSFVGEASLAFGRFVRGKATFSRADLLALLQDCGIQALPIVTLISVLVGLIFGFVGAVQLQAFGAEIYVASLVGIAMVRVMGAIMTGIIMAGRTGARFAAEIGTMQVNEEIDALQTLGISPMEYLVLPRMLALTLMMPLLCLYADLMGILGGFIVGVGMLDLNILEYYHQTKISVQINNLWIGLLHSFVFGILVALAGCLRGLQCGRSATAVGSATTSAVVTGIVAIIVATAIITVICNVLGI
jgi:phospholipid/cholesterol/gamma-HCH transport system permease protein